MYFKNFREEFCKKQSKQPNKYIKLSQFFDKPLGFSR